MLVNSKMKSFSHPGTYIRSTLLYYESEIDIFVTTFLNLLWLHVCRICVSEKKKKNPAK